MSPCWILFVRVFFFSFFLYELPEINRVSVANAPVGIEMCAAKSLEL